MSETNIIERDQAAAVEAINVQFGAGVQNALYRQPLAVANAARAVWGEAPLIGNTKAHQEVDRFRRHDVESFVGSLIQRSDALNATQDIPESRLDTEDFTAEQRATFARRDERPEEPERRPAPYDQDAEVDEVDLKHEQDDQDAEKWADQYASIPEDPARGEETFGMAVGGTVSDETVAQIEGAQPLVAPDAAPQDDGVTSALLMNDEDTVRRALLNQQGIVVLRKVSKGKVRGGYSLKTPDLIEAILATDLSADDIAARIAAAS